MKTFFTRAKFTIHIYTAIRARNEKNAKEMAKRNAFEMSIDDDCWEFHNPIKHWYWVNSTGKVYTTLVTKKEFEDCLDENYEKKDFSHIDYE